MWTLRKLLVPLALCLVAAGYQPNAAPSQPAPTRDGQLFNALPARCIGPATFGGRITEVAVVESNPAVMYVAAATGGLWKTTDAGITCKPVFDEASSLCMGAVAVAQANPDVVWVGTGEGNILRSVSVGDGVYKSTDGGKTWKHMGLKETRHITRIVIHPKNPDIVYVAALGRGWGPNTERGLFKTTDGGTTWSRVFYIDESTGATDLAMDLSEPDTLYVCAYTFLRDAFSGSTPRIQFGPKAGFYKTTDGGKTWERLQAGLPDRPLGRCGIDICRKDPNILFAIVQTDKSAKGGKGGGGADDKDAGGVFRSADKGKTWSRTGMVNPQHWFYFGQIRVDPSDEQRVYVLGVSFFTSKDGGKSFTPQNGGHSDHHALWINPKNSNHVVLGNDGGLFVSKDKAQSWQAIRDLPTGQFYGIAVDMRKPYRVYGGLQDNGSWGGPSATYNDVGIVLKDWNSIHGGDGFYCQVDPTDPDTVYAESQEGALARINVKGGGKGGGMGGGKASTNIRPGGAGNRFNWNSPILISPHDPKTIFFGGQYLFKSTDRGDNWTKISADLSRGGVKADTGHTITTIAESKVKQGLLWVGTDDGRLHVSKNDGKEWTEVTKNVPALTNIGWVTRIIASYYAEGTAYLTVDRHRNDDLHPYAYKTTDFGETWVSINGDLPAEGNLHCIRESSRNPNLLFLGTEFGLYGTLDGGQHWNNMKNGLPAAVLVHDLVIHPRDRELVVGTHGRSIYVIDISALEELTPKILAGSAHLCDVHPVTAFKVKKEAAAKEPTGYVAPNPPYGAMIYYYVKDAGPQVVKLNIVDKDGRNVIASHRVQQPGLHRLIWDLRPGLGNDGPTVPPGEYTISMQMGNRFFSKAIRVDAE